MCCRAGWQRPFAGVRLAAGAARWQHAVCYGETREMANPHVSLVWTVSVSTPLEKQVGVLKAKTNDFGRVSLSQVCDVGMSH